MANSVSTTLTPSSRNGPVNQLDYAIQSRLYDVNTLLPCEILTVNGDGTYNVQSLLNPRNAKGQIATDENNVPIPPPKMYGVTAGIIAGNGCAIIIPYAVGDKVWVSFCQRDITNAKNSKFKRTTPASARALSMCDGVIKCHADDGGAYTTVIQFGADGSITVTTPDGKPINVNSGGDVNISVNGKAEVTADQVDIISGNINLGEDGVGILNEETQFQVAGVQTGGSTLPVTIVPGTASTTVKAAS